MSLPKINAPIFTMTLPSTKQEVVYKAFTVKEEKILLMAAQAEDMKSIGLAINQILKNCIVSDMNVDLLPVFDVEYCFIQVRSKSVGNIIKLNIVDEEEDETHLVIIDVDDIKVFFPETHNNMIDLTDDMKLKMKYPSYGMVDKIGNDEMSANSLLRSSMDKLISKEEVFDFGDYSAKEIDDFVDSLSTKNMRDIEEFFISMPKVSYDIEDTTKSGKTKTRKLEGLTSFFSR
jgi:hypothetical protein